MSDKSTELALNEAIDKINEGIKEFNKTLNAKTNTCWYKSNYFNEIINVQGNLSQTKLKLLGLQQRINQK